MQHAKKPLLDLASNLQMFAEDPNPTDDGGKQEPPKQKHTDEEYDKLKANFDKTSSEIAELKKQLKSKQSDEEKKAEEEESRKKEVDDLKREVATYKIQSSLQEVFEKEETEKLIKPILDNDVDTLVKNLVELRKAYKDKIYANAKEEFSKSAKIPGGNADDALPSDVQNFIDSKKSKGKNAKDYYFGNKQEK
jgi:flagellar biosynthesis GTPase FlhF